MASPKLFILLISVIIFHGNPYYSEVDGYASCLRASTTIFSDMFKAIFPKAYSYAFNNASSLNRFRANRYLITFYPPQLE
ncbi:hypothetical protein QYE76_065430 [Lolium multiflorum]|uniref:Uncharacterized protein n=1 Tax=Lolium multiflorum TaxID=4521 RepID=A0AAD8SAX1_LOLMU|nr:hypothetical protein QYE76_065430 [Lolium multiflorum]